MRKLIFNLLYFLPTLVVTFLLVYILGFTGWGFEIVFIGGIAFVAIFILGIALSAQLKEARASLGTIGMSTLFIFSVLSSVRLNTPIASDDLPAYWLVTTPFLSIEYWEFWNEYASFFLILLLGTVVYAILSMFIILKKLDASNRALNIFQSFSITIVGILIFALHFAPLLLYGASFASERKSEYLSKVYEEVFVSRYIDRREPIFTLQNASRSVPCTYGRSLIEELAENNNLTENSKLRHTLTCFSYVSYLDPPHETLQLPHSSNQTFKTYISIENFKKGDIVAVTATLPKGSRLWIETFENEAYKEGRSRVFDNYEDVSPSSGQLVGSSDGGQRSELVYLSHETKTYTALYPINTNDLKYSLTVVVWIPPDEPMEAELVEITRLPME